MNRIRLSRLAVSRMRSSAGDTLSQLCVWHVLPRTALPLAPPLPSPPRPRMRRCSATSSVLWASPTSPGRTSSDYGCDLADADRPGRTFQNGPRGAPGSRTCGFHACERSQTTQGRVGARPAPPPPLALARPSPCCLPLISTASAPWTVIFSRLNALPACSPINASPAYLRIPTHDPGSLRLAKSSSTELASAATCRSPDARRGLDAGCSPSASQAENAEEQPTSVAIIPAPRGRPRSSGSASWSGCKASGRAPA